MVLLACWSPPKCPTVGEDLEIGYALERKIWDSVSSLPMDPSSYEPVSYQKLQTFGNRDDGGRYYRQLRVRFTAKDLFGGRVRGDAVVTLREGSEDECVVAGARLRAQTAGPSAQASPA